MKSPRNSPPISTCTGTGPVTGVTAVRGTAKAGEGASTRSTSCAVEDIARTAFSRAACVGRASVCEEAVPERVGFLGRTT